MNPIIKYVPRDSKGKFTKFRRKFLKVIGFQIALLVSLLVVQMGMQFATSYKWVGFAKKDQSTWIGIAETAQADSVSCNQELDTLRQQKDEAIRANNPDLYQ